MDFKTKLQDIEQATKSLKTLEDAFKKNAKENIEKHIRELCTFYTKEDMIGVVVYLMKQINEMERKFAEKEPLPFSDEQYDGEFPALPIDVAAILINAVIKCPTNSFQRAFGSGETYFASKYSTNDLREIAEHLLAYCNNSDDEDNIQRQEE